MKFNSDQEIINYLIKNPVEKGGQIYHPIPFDEFKMLKTSSNKNEVYRKWKIIEKTFQDIFSDLNGLNVLDIGANAGFYTFSLAKKGAKVTAFEPISIYSDIGIFLAENKPNIKVKWYNKPYTSDLVKNEKFDVALMLSVFQWMALGGDRLTEASRELKEISEKSDYLIFELGFNAGKSCLYTDNPNHYEVLIDLLQKNTVYNKFELLGMTQLWKNCNRYLVLCNKKSKKKKQQYNIFEVEIDKCISSVSGLSFSNKKGRKTHYFVDALNELINKGNVKYGDSQLKKYYDNFQPQTLGELFFLNKKVDAYPLSIIPPIAKVPLPWTDISFYAKLFAANVFLVKNGGILPSYEVELFFHDNVEKILFSPLEQWVPLYTKYDGTFHLCGPQNEESGEKLYEKLISIFNSIKNIGYQPEKFEEGYIRGVMIKYKDDFRFLVTDGQHRISSLSALNYDRVLVKLDERFKHNIFDIDKIDDWPFIKLNYYSKKVVLKMVKSFFNNNLHISSCKNYNFKKTYKKLDVIFFGASGMGEKYYEKYKDIYNVVCFCDNDPNKWGKHLKGIEIISPNEECILQKYKIVITSMYFKEILPSLLKKGLKNIEVKGKKVLFAEDVFY